MRYKASRTLWHSGPLGSPGVVAYCSWRDQRRVSAAPLAWTDSMYPGRAWVLSVANPSNEPNHPSGVHKLLYLPHGHAVSPVQVDRDRQCSLLGEHRLLLKRIYRMTTHSHPGYRLHPSLHRLSLLVAIAAASVFDQRSPSCTSYPSNPALRIISKLQDGPCLCLNAGSETVVPVRTISAPCPPLLKPNSP